MSIVSLFVLFFAGITPVLSAPEKNKEVLVMYSLLQAYDGLGGSYVELPDGTVLKNVDGYRSLEKATRYQWNIFVHGKGIAGPQRNSLLSGWVKTVSIGSGHGFESATMYNTVMVSESDPRYKNRIEAGPTPDGWAYVKYEVTSLGRKF